MLFNRFLKDPILLQQNVYFILVILTVGMIKLYFWHVM